MRTCDFPPRIQTTAPKHPHLFSPHITGTPNHHHQRHSIRKLWCWEDFSVHIEHTSLTLYSTGITHNHKSQRNTPHQTTRRYIDADTCLARQIQSHARKARHTTGKHVRPERRIVGGCSWVFLSLCALCG